MLISNTPAAQPAAQTTASLATPAIEQIDPSLVCRKIADLATPDETLPYDEQAERWLEKRANKIIPQLIAALDDKNPQVAEKCLYILRNVPASKDLTDALVAKAGDQTSPLRYQALLQIEKSDADPRVVRLLDQASTQAKDFPNPILRARWAGLAGHKDRAVQILKPLLAEPYYGEYSHIEAIRLLGELKEPASIGLLESIAAGDHWELAAEAYRALAKIDPAKHGLTEDQVKLLNNWRGFKESTENQRRRMNELAKLNAKELHPFVMQMLRNKENPSRQAALVILAAWKDKEALPRIIDLMQDKRNFGRKDAVATYLSIDDSRQAQDKVLQLLDENDEFSNESILRGIVMADIPTDRKATILSSVKYNPRTPYAVPHAVRYETFDGGDIQKLLITLMEKETNLQTLAGYCEIAAQDKEKRFSPQVRRAMQLLLSDPAVSAGDGSRDDGMAYAAQLILDAVAAYNHRDFTPGCPKTHEFKKCCDSHSRPDGRSKAWHPQRDGCNLCSIGLQ